MTRPTKFTINLAAIRANTALASEFSPNARLMACVKADAYGHGMVAVSKAIEEHVQGFAVACVDEAIELRGAGIVKPILLLEGVYDDSELKAAQENDFWMVIHCKEQIDRLDAGRLSTPLNIWLKMDSGMHRLGFPPAEYLAAYSALRDNQYVASITHMTHFCCADELANSCTQDQLAIFSDTCESLPGLRSAANSAAIMAWPETHYDWVRPGFMLYGGNPFSSSAPMGKTEKLQAAMTLSTEVISLRSLSPGDGVGYNKSWRCNSPAQVATLAVGYGDGYPRNTPNGTPVWVNGIRAKTVGYIAMDMMMVDVTGIEAVKVGSSVELWGENLPINEVAQASGYSAYELMTRLTSRAPRRYID